MKLTTINGSALIALALFIGVSPTGTAQNARGGAAGAPQGVPPAGPSVCIDAGHCEFADDLDCKAKDLRTFGWFAGNGKPPTGPVGATVIADFADGVSSDGRGPYVPGAEGVGVSLVGTMAVVGATTPRSLTVNLNNPVPCGGAVPLGIVIESGIQTPDGKETGFGIFTAPTVLDHKSQSLHGIPVGQSVSAAQINVFFHINGRFHVLQIGPQPWLVCHTKAPPVNGNGTSAGTIYRTGPTMWAVDLPAGSKGRLFDVSNISKATPSAVIDRGLYYVHLHYEIGR